MAGEVLLTWRGREILLRRFAKGAAPFGGFEAVDAATGETIPGLTGTNCGEVLLGVGREVWQRSAFVGQSGIGVDANPELERRIDNITTRGIAMAPGQSLGDGARNASRLVQRFGTHGLRLPGHAVVAFLLNMPDRIAKRDAAAVPNREQGYFIVKINKAFDNNFAAFAPGSGMRIFPCMINVVFGANDALPLAG